MHYDYAIIGAGMAGASLAAELAGRAPDLKILVLEAEDRPGYHATGRSAAFWEECYGGPQIAPLTRASHAFLQDGGFLRPRGALYIGRAKDAPAIADFAAQFGEVIGGIERWDADRLHRKFPAIQREWEQAIWVPACADIDVAGLHQHYLKCAQSNGVNMQMRARLEAAHFDGAYDQKGPQKKGGNTGGAWHLQCMDGRAFSADLLINAAGAWSDAVAQMARAVPLSIKPMQRTVAQLRMGTQLPDDLPLVLDIDGQFYFKNDNGRMWLSPQDETICAPCDAAAEELAVAQAIERLAKVADWPVQAVERKWAGLRSFAPDRLPVYGFDPVAANFLWFAGQGGFGIQTAPAAAALMADIILGTGPSPMVRNIDAEIYSPARFPTADAVR